jgi:hypothetical protein
VPVVAIVDGVKIMFYPNEHPPAHFHAKIAEFQAVVDIDRLAIGVCRDDGTQEKLDRSNEQITSD